MASSALSHAALKHTSLPACRTGRQRRGARSEERGGHAGNAAWLAHYDEASLFLTLRRQQPSGRPALAVEHRLSTES
ncbi:unnamed protein product [Soboliphyme baturini]|uniref:DUF1534 domain-containing protein n=1 Tax=Soboliphyme baturini TaxID=241478 RepID=A0A183IEH3_9BILA|nr:unnamed protein product [Soboliphyme baturini]